MWLQITILGIIFIALIGGWIYNNYVMYNPYYKKRRKK